MLQFNWRQEVLAEDWTLLLAADPARGRIESYLGKSAILEARIKDQLVGLLLLVSKSTERGEIVNLSVNETQQNQGIGSQLIQRALIHGKKIGYQSMEVSTGTTSFCPLYLYQKNGFRVESVEQDYFTKGYAEELIENGLVLKDRLILAQSL